MYLYCLVVWFMPSVVSCCTQDFVIGLIIVCENIDVRIVVHMPYEFLGEFSKRQERV